MCSQVDQDWGKWKNQVSDNERSHDHLHVEVSTVLESEEVQKDGPAAPPQRPGTHLHSPGGRTAADLTLCLSRDRRGGGLRSSWSLPQSALAADTDSLDGYKHQNLISHSSGGWKSKTGVPVRWGEGPLLGCRLLTVPSPSRRGEGVL